jgi:hypothetical protein
MEFEDKHSFNAQHFYPCPNEGTREWHEMLKGTPIYRAAGICSSGEVGLFGILPVTRRKLVLIDHSYASLNCAMTKYLLLADLGPDEMYRLFTTAEHTEVEEACEKVQDKLPVSVKNHAQGDRYNTKKAWFSTGDAHSLEVYNATTGRSRLRIQRPGARKISYSTTEIQRHWNQHISTEMVKRAYDKLHMVKFVHGDLSDLKDDGPFGLLYLSNATEHSDRTRNWPQFDNLRSCLRPNAYVITAARLGLSARTYDTAPMVGVESLKKERGGTLNWTQQMYRVSKPKPVPVAA